MRVEVLGIEHRTPKPDNRQSQPHAAGVALEDMPVQVKLACGHHLEFPNHREMVRWLREASHRFERKGEHYTVRCDRCGAGRPGPGSEPAAPKPIVGTLLSDGRIFIRTK